MYMVTKRISNIWAFGFATVDFIIIAFWLFNWHIVMEKNNICGSLVNTTGYSAVCMEAFISTTGQKKCII